MSKTNQFSIQQVVNLLNQGNSIRGVARLLGRETQESTIRDMLKRHKVEIPTKIHRAITKRPKILMLDIETAPMIGQLWSLWQNGIGLNQMERDWSVISYTAKWFGEDQIFYNDLRDKADIEDDSDLIEELWHLLDEADFVVGHNIRKFDIRKIKARMLLQGLMPPSTFRTIDTLQIVKAVFQMTSNKLEYLTERLCKKYKKSKHREFAGHELWKECLRGNRRAWEVMEEYNKFDVLSNEELFEILIPWDNRLPNFDLYMNDPTDMSEWEPNGYHYTNLGKYRRYRNKYTGQQRRGRTNLLSKEKRKSLLANIIH